MMHMQGGQTTVVDATWCSAMIGRRGDGLSCVALSRSNSLGEFQHTSHGAYRDCEDATFVAGLLVYFLKQVIQGNGSFTDNDVHQWHGAADARLHGRGHHEMA